MIQRAGWLFALIAGAAIFLVSPALAAADSIGFTSPSGNIGCIDDSSALRCDSRERTWSPPPRPADCPSQAGYGQGISCTPTAQPPSSAPVTPPWVPGHRWTTAPIRPAAG